jgi:hypothetical protein
LATQPQIWQHSIKESPNEANNSEKIPSTPYQEKFQPKILLMRKNINNEYLGVPSNPLIYISSSTQKMKFFQLFHHFWKLLLKPRRITQRPPINKSTLLVVMSKSLSWSTTIKKFCMKRSFQ